MFQERYGLFKRLSLLRNFPRHDCLQGPVCSIDNPEYSDVGKDSLGNHVFKELTEGIAEARDVEVLCGPGRLTENSKLVQYAPRRLLTEALKFSPA